MNQRVCPGCSVLSETEGEFCPQCGTSYSRSPERQEPYTAPSRHGQATASMVLGIVGLLLFGIILGILAIVFANKARADMKATPGMYTNGGMATAGLVLGIIDLVAGVIWLSVWF